MAGPQTVYLGQFVDDNADKVVDALEAAGIVWWAKSSGRLARFVFAGDWGVRVFVEADRIDEARAIAEQVTGSRPR